MQVFGHFERTYHVKFEKKYDQKVLGKKLTGRPVGNFLVPQCSSPKKSMSHSLMNDLTPV
jgi:hypothetical protein